MIPITDGEESCKGDSLKAAAELTASGLDVTRSGSWRRSPSRWPVPTLFSGDALRPLAAVNALRHGARDTRLERVVAVKILRQDLAAYPDRQARFEREAKAIAAVNHPHICALYDVGEHHGTT